MKLLKELTDSLLSDPDGISEESYGLLLDLYSEHDIDPYFDEIIECTDGRYFYPEDSENVT